MHVREHELEDVKYGVVELDLFEGYHAGTTVTVSIAEFDGVPVVQIDTPQETETHELMRVYVNDELVSGKEVGSAA